MATLNENPGGKAAKGRTKKTAPRVDLTAMVDLMFLLTTFFMLTTSLGQLNAADIAKPVDCNDCSLEYPASRTLTILLGKNHQAVAYAGTTENAAMKVVPMERIQDEIALQKKLVAKTHNHNPSKYLIVIIKPTATSKFQDFVDMVDEMKIADIKSYSIDDKNITQREQDYLKLKGL